MTTPEYYPLSLNALTNACNQKSNRDPVTSYEDSTVMDALASLRDRGMVAFVSEAGSRVEKYRHKLGERFNFTRGELAVVAVLLLRGPQTAGELRQRTERHFGFQDTEAVLHTLEGLANREDGALTRQLPRQPGTKEPRWAHLLCGEVAANWEAGEADTAPAPGLSHRVSELERELAALREEFERFRAQFS